MKTLKVENMTSNQGNKIANQFIVRTAKGRYFQSYDSIIAFIPNKQGAKIQLDSYYWDYSKTTGKYRNLFLNEDKKATEKKIKDKVYLLKDLNT
ncbi:MAG: hypothetical protein GY739_12210 [Mesoflavibacter sp.]|nr:hypothetical protein [Mesoflavibacter sp.]